MYHMIIIDDSDSPKDVELPRIPTIGEEIVWYDDKGALDTGLSRDYLVEKVTNVRFNIPLSDAIKCDSITLFADRTVVNYNPVEEIE